jgi:hypothetical protein
VTGAAWRQLPDDAPEPERGAVVLDRDHDQWRRGSDGRWRLGAQTAPPPHGGFDWHDVVSHEPLMIAIATVDTDRLLKLQGSAKVMVADAEADNERWDGEEFTGHTVATQFGELRAMIQSLALAVDYLAGVLLTINGDGA